MIPSCLVILACLDHASDPRNDFARPMRSVPECIKCEYFYCVDVLKVNILTLTMSSKK